jgi:hypothetical protein
MEAEVEVGMTVKEKLHTLVDRLDDAQALEVLALVGRLEARGIAPGASLTDAPQSEPPRMLGQAFDIQTPMDLAALALSQGVRPITNFNDLLGDFWPEDETADQFVAAVREWRRDGDYA